MKEKYEGDFVIFLHLTNDYETKGAVDFYSLRCLCPVMDIEYNIGLTVDSEHYDNIVIANNNYLDSRFKKRLLNYVKWKKIEKCYYFSNKEKIYFEVKNGKFQKNKKYGLMDILLDTTDIEFLNHIPFSSLYNVLKNAKGLYKIAGKPEVFFI